MEPDHAGPLCFVLEMAEHRVPHFGLQGLQVVRLLARLRVLRPDAAASSRGWDEVRPLPAGDPYRSRN